MAGIGLVQLKYLDRDNAYRRQVASWYDENLKKYDPLVKIVPTPQNCESSRHLYIIQAEDRDELILALNENEIYPGVHYRDNTDYSMYSYAKGSCPTAHEISSKIISLPMHLEVTKADVDLICSNIIKYIHKKQ